MKAKDLISSLKKVDPDLEVLCYCEGDLATPPGHHFRLLEIEAVDVSEGEWCKGTNGVLSMKFGHTKESRKHVFIHLTPDF